MILHPPTSRYHLAQSEIDRKDLCRFLHYVTDLLRDNLGELLPLLGVGVLQGVGPLPPLHDPQRGGQLAALAAGAGGGGSRRGGCCCGCGGGGGSGGGRLGAGRGGALGGGGGGGRGRPPGKLGGGPGVKLGQISTLQCKEKTVKIESNLD